MTDEASASANGIKQRRRSCAASEDKALSGPDRYHQLPHSNDLKYPFHVVGEHMQTHLRTDMLKSTSEEVRRTHPMFQRTEWMLNRLSPYPHHAW